MIKKPNIRHQEVKKVKPQPAKKLRAFFVKMTRIQMLAVFLVLVLVVVYALTGFRSKVDRQKLAEPSFCAVNEDCSLYNCTNCGNQLWINKNKQSNEGCTFQISIDCKCENNICKRVYK